MLENVKIYTSDKYWKQIFTDLGATVVDAKTTADIVFDDIDIVAPVSVIDLQNIICDHVNNTDVIHRVFGKYVVLPALQHKIIVLLYKNPNMTMSELKTALGVLPDVATHAVENAVYQLRKVYGRDIIQNIDGKYKIGGV